MSAAQQVTWPRPSWASERTVDTSGWGPYVTVIRDTREERHEHVELVLWRHVFIGADHTVDDSGSDVIVRWQMDPTHDRDLEEFTVREEDIDTVIAALQKAREIFNSGDRGPVKPE